MLGCDHSAARSCGIGATHLCSTPTDAVQKDVDQESQNSIGVDGDKRSLPSWRPSGLTCANVGGRRIRLRGKRAWFEYVVGAGVLNLHPQCESRLDAARLGEAAVQWCERTVVGVASKALDGRLHAHAPRRVIQLSTPREERPCSQHMTR